MNVELVSGSCGIPTSLLIESIGAKEEPKNYSRGALNHYSFECVTEGGYKFTTTMLGFDREHAYKRLRGQTDGSILVAL